MAYRIMERGRDTMSERGGDPEKLMKKIDEIHEMLDELSECLEEMMGEDEMSERGRWEARGIMEREGNMGRGMNEHSYARYGERRRR